MPKQCKRGHEYDGLACSTCAAAASSAEQLRIAESQIRSGVKPVTNGEHFSLGRESWRHIFREYGWSMAEATVPALCGAAVKLTDMDVRREPEDKHCNCGQCKTRVEYLTNAARSA